MNPRTSRCIFWSERKYNQPFRRNRVQFLCELYYGDGGSGSRGGYGIVLIILVLVPSEGNEHCNGSDNGDDNGSESIVGEDGGVVNEAGNGSTCGANDDNDSGGNFNW